MEYGDDGISDAAWGCPNPLGNRRQSEVKDFCSVVVYSLKNLQIQIPLRDRVMAKRKLDEVEYVDDGISDDFVNEIGEVFENQYGNDVTDSQMVQFGRELDQQQLDALDTGLP